MYQRARYYDSEMGEFVNQDPAGYVDGASIYRGYMELSAADPSGRDRYLTQFGANVDALHVAVAVDTWECDKLNGEWRKTGVVTFDFLVNVDNVLGILMGAFVYKGRVDRDDGNTLESPMRQASSPCQDIAMLKGLEKDFANPPNYSAVFYNCVNWSAFHINNGLDQPTGAECDCLCKKDPTLQPPPRPKGGTVGPATDANGDCVKECTKKMDEKFAKTGVEPTSLELIDCINDCENEKKKKLNK
ncbi:hypothetical protein OAG68_02540 [bacterium]|nr:hypothetical protein [bacterium]